MPEPLDRLLREGRAYAGPGGRRGPRDALLDQAALERADGRSQFDYLRRLAGLDALRDRGA